MKGSLKLRPRRALSRREAWGCFTANLAVPGSGSLAAGYRIGYVQMAAAFSAEILTVVTGIPTVQWGLSKGLALLHSDSDSLEPLAQFWLHSRWPILFIGLFVFSILWAMTTSLTILSRATRDGVPPVIV